MSPTEQKRLVFKVGGTALGDANGFRQIAKIWESNPAYTALVPSAPATHRERVTELLRSIEHTDERWQIYGRIQDWLLEIVRGLELDQQTEDWVQAEIMALSNTIDAAGASCNWSWVVSRGEFWSGSILAKLCSLPFVDPSHLIKFTRKGVYDPRATKKAFAEHSLPERFVMPGFYGADMSGRIHLFPRNGSDISSAIIATHIHADRLDIGRKGVPGIFVMSPALQPDPSSQLTVIKYLSHEHAREMTYRGDPVLHPLALVPLAKAGIEVHLFDVDRGAKASGTHIVKRDHPRLPKKWTVLGLAEQSGFTVFTLKHVGLNERTDFTDKVARVLSEFGIGYEHQATGVDHVSIVLKNDAIRSRHDEIARRFRKVCRASVTYCTNESSLCIVGHDLGSNPVALGGLLVVLGTGLMSEPTGSEVRLSFQSMGAAGTSYVVGMPSGAVQKAAYRLYRNVLK